MRAASTSSPQTLMSSAQRTDVHETPRQITCSSPVALTSEFTEADLTDSVILCILMTLKPSHKVITIGHAVSKEVQEIMLMHVTLCSLHRITLTLERTFSVFQTQKHCKYTSWTLQ